MPVLNTADKVMLGVRPADAVYAGDVQVWPSSDPLAEGLLGWYDMASLAAVPPGSVITGWRDGSANRLDLTPAVTGQAPTYVTDAGDGHPALVFPDGVRRGMVSANVGLTGAAPWTQVTIFKRGSAVNQSVTGLGIENTLQMADLMAFNHPWDGTPVFIAHMHGGGNDTFPYSPPPLRADGVFHSLVSTYDGRIILSVDGISQVPMTVALNLGSGPYHVGDGVYPPLPGLGGGSAIRGTALYDRVLSPTEIADVITALS